MERTILHSDINCCYAAIEHLHHPELAGKPLAVGGDPESRHGIVLTADYIAKKHGVKTGMALWQAKQVCPDITFISPRMDLYLRFSRMAHEIYSEYTDLQEPYGIDESWLDVSARLTSRQEVSSTRTPSSALSWQTSALENSATKTICASLPPRSVTDTYLKKCCSRITFSAENSRATLSSVNLPPQETDSSPLFSCSPFSRSRAEKLSQSLQAL